MGRRTFHLSLDPEPMEFVFLHNVAVDSQGNVYTAEVGGGRRVQKFLRN